jgi:DNA-binding CsgD family transcriptional regulator
MNFALYFMKRLLDGQEEIVSESVEPKEFRRAVRRAEKELKGDYIKRLYEKYPRIQYNDIEDAFDEAMQEVKKGGAKSESSVRRSILKAMERRLASANKKRRSVGKSLSCIGAVKSSLRNGQSISDLMKRAEKILTNQEMKVVSMCAEGKSVRKMADDMDISFPTVWRTLNSALDKIRVSYGMRPRHLDRRGKA